MRKEDVYWFVLCFLSSMMGNMVWLTLTTGNLAFFVFGVLQYMSYANTSFPLRNLPIDEAHFPKHRIGGAAKCVLDIFVVGTAVMIRHFFGWNLSAALILIGVTVSSIGLWRLVYFSRDISLWDVPIHVLMQFAVFITGDSGVEALKAVLILCGVITFYRYWFYDYYFVDVIKDEVDAVINDGGDGEVINTEDDDHDKLSRFNRVFLFFIFLYSPWYGICCSQYLQSHSRSRNPPTVTS